MPQHGKQQETLFYLNQYLVLIMLFLPVLNNHSMLKLEDLLRKGST